MSEEKVNKISPRTNCGTVQLGDSGDTITIPAGATITNNGTAAGFGATGAASWDTTVKTGDFTAVSGVGYFVNTTGGAITVTLPASPDAGAVIAISDYANTADTNNITLARNGSNIEGNAEDFVINVEGVAITFVYVDATKGWITTDTGQSSNAFISPFIEATGGTITTCGDFKIHTFTGPGNFTVTSAGSPAGSTTVDYLVLAGGGGGGSDGYPAPRGGGGGGAGGYRLSACTYCEPAGRANPCGALTVEVQAYPVIVGAGGAGGPPSTCAPVANGSRGGVSSFSTITSAGGGAGNGHGSSTNGDMAVTPGGSGGGFQGEGTPTPSHPTGGKGNTPPTTPVQGFNAGDAAGSPNYNYGGGGGAGGRGSNSPPTGSGGAGGVGSPSAITGSAVNYGGGGGSSPSGGASPCGTGGGALGNNGTTNRGGGGAGNRPGTGGSGGSGIVIIRYKFQ